MERLNTNSTTHELSLLGTTALELLAQPVTLPEANPQPQRPAPPQPTPPQRFPTNPKPTPPDIYGYPDVSPPDEEWLYE